MTKKLIIVPATDTRKIMMEYVLEKEEQARIQAVREEEDFQRELVLVQKLIMSKITHSAQEGKNYYYFDFYDYPYFITIVYEKQSRFVLDTQRAFREAGYTTEEGAESHYSLIFKWIGA